MTPSERVDEMIKKYSEEEAIVTNEIRDPGLSRFHRERDWVIKILLAHVLDDLRALRDEIHIRENYER